MSIFCAFETHGHVYITVYLFQKYLVLVSEAQRLLDLNEFAVQWIFFLQAHDISYFSSFECKLVPISRRASYIQPTFAPSIHGLSSLARMNHLQNITYLDNTAKQTAS